jgi:hypothetical protein
MMPGLLGVLEEYDRTQREYIQQLETEVIELRKEKIELSDQLMRYIATVDRMKLELIMSGALRKPEASDDSHDSEEQHHVRPL